MYNHILIPIAPGHASECSASFSAARRLLAEGGKSSILSVLEEIPSFVDAYVPAGQMERNIADVKSELTSELGAEDVEIHVISGHSAISILDWSNKNVADCIVISSHRPGFSDYFIGSTASRVVRHAQCSVVVMR